MGFQSIKCQRKKSGPSIFEIPCILDAGVLKTISSQSNLFLPASLNSCFYSHCLLHWHRCLHFDSNEEIRSILGNVKQMKQLGLKSVNLNCSQNEDILMVNLSIAKCPLQIKKSNSSFLYEAHSQNTTQKNQRIAFLTKRGMILFSSSLMSTVRSIRWPLAPSGSWNEQKLASEGKLILNKKFFVRELSTHNTILLSIQGILWREQPKVKKKTTKISSLTITMHIRKNGNEQDNTSSFRHH